MLNLELKNRTYPLVWTLPLVTKVSELHSLSLHLGRELRSWTQGIGPGWGLETEAPDGVDIPKLKCRARLKSWVSWRGKGGGSGNRPGARAAANQGRKARRLRRKRSPHRGQRKAIVVIMVASPSVARADHGCLSWRQERTTDSLDFAVPKMMPCGPQTWGRGCCNTLLAEQPQQQLWRGWLWPSICCWRRRPAWSSRPPRPRCIPQPLWIRLPLLLPLPRLSRSCPRSLPCLRTSTQGIQTHYHPHSHLSRPLNVHGGKGSAQLQNDLVSGGSAYLLLRVCGVRSCGKGIEGNRGDRILIGIL